MLCRVFARLSTIYELLGARKYSLNTQHWTHADLREFRIPHPRNGIPREIVLRLGLNDRSACVGMALLLVYLYGGESSKHGIE